MTPFESRLAAAERFEQIVAERLRVVGWEVAATGQGLMSDDARKMLRQSPAKQLARWYPDLTARLGRFHFFIDAKNSAPHHITGNHAIETSSLESHDDAHLTGGLPVLYAFPHPRACTGADDAGDDIDIRYMGHRTFMERSVEGRYGGNGSGTPFRVTPCSGMCYRHPLVAFAVDLNTQHREEVTQ